MPPAQPRPPHDKTQHHGRELPLRVGTRTSPLARAQTRAFLELLTRVCPVLGAMEMFEEIAIRTTGDVVQNQRLAEIGGKGLFAKELHEALRDERIDFAVHSLKDLETRLPFGITLACMLAREDARDALILGPGCAPPDSADPLAALPHGALVGTSSARRQAQLLHARPDLRVVMLRGNVQSRLDRVRRGEFAASLLALAGLRRLGLEASADMILPPEVMLPAAGQGIVAVTIRARDTDLRDLLGSVEDEAARLAATAERAMLDALDGSCRTPIGAQALALADGQIRLEGLVARTDGSFLLRRSLVGPISDAARIGAELGAELRADSPADLFA